MDEAADSAAGYGDGSTGAAAPRRGGGGGWRGFGGAAGPVEKVPKERRGQDDPDGCSTFFRPYRAQVAVVLFAILLTSFIGLINPLLLKQLIDVAIPQKDWSLLQCCSSG